MRDIKFSQEELVLLLNLLNTATINSKLTIGDILVVAPLISKIDKEVIKPKEEEKAEKPVFTKEEPKVN